MQWHDVKSTAAALGVSQDTVRRMVKRGELRHRRFGRLIRIPETELLPKTDVVRFPQVA
jgi:excisionase family DNA binding protein